MLYFIPNGFKKSNEKLSMILVCQPPWPAGDDDDDDE